MPLSKGSSKEVVSKNISEFHAGKTYAHTAEKFGKKRADAQAVAVALNTARKSNGGSVSMDESPLNPFQGLTDDTNPYANGGMAYADGGGTSWFAKKEAGSMTHSGMIDGLTGGRADKKPIGVGGGSYVLPADIVSSVGGGNSAAGANAFNQLFKMGPYGSSVPKGIHKGAKAIRQRFADGGETQVEDHVPIIASDGEFIVTPDKVAEIGGGDIEHGHASLDEMVKHIREQTIKTLKQLPGPKAS